MPDLIDKTSDDAELVLKSQIKTILNNKAEKLRPIGKCHYCGEHSNLHGSLFCDADCATDYEYVNKRKGR